MQQPRRPYCFLEIHTLERNSISELHGQCDNDRQNDAAVERHEEMLTMLTMNSSEARCTETRAINTLAIATARRVFTVCVWHVAFLTLPAGMTDTPACTILAITVTQRRTYAWQHAATSTVRIHHVNALNIVHTTQPMFTSSMALARPQAGSGSRTLPYAMTDIILEDLLKLNMSVGTFWHIQQQ